MKIGDNTPVGNTSSLRRKAGASSTQSAGGFEELLGATESDAAESSAATSDAAAIGSLDGMLALQGMSDEEARKREAVKRGHSMLDALERLRSALLAGRIPPEVIMELSARLARQRAETFDPKLLEIIDDIELRVAVEKAKLEKAFNERGIVI